MTCLRWSQPPLLLCPQTAQSSEGHSEAGSIHSVTDCQSFGFSRLKKTERKEVIGLDALILCRTGPSI